MVYGDHLEAGLIGPLFGPMEHEHEVPSQLACSIDRRLIQESLSPGHCVRISQAKAASTMEGRGLMFLGWPRRPPWNRRRRGCAKGHSSWQTGQVQRLGFGCGAYMLGVVCTYMYMYMARESACAVGNARYPQLARVVFPG